MPPTPTATAPLPRRRPSAPAALLLLALAGCAPSTLSPMVLRFNPGKPGDVDGAIGLRSGPRVSTPVATPANFAGDANSFSLPQWSVAYLLDLSSALDERTSIHYGAQGEFYYPLPFPAYGLHLGVSHRIPLGQWSISPSLLARGASDFGIGISQGGPAAVAGGEASVTVAWHPEAGVAVALAPFCNVQQVWGPNDAQEAAVYAGGVVAMELGQAPGARVEALAGFGRVFMHRASWNVPILGLQVTY